MAFTLSGTNGVVGAGFTVDASGVSVTAGVGTFSSLNAAASGLTGALPALDAANLTSINAAQLVGVCTSGLTKTGGFGKILQFVQHKFTTGQFTTTSNSYVDVTGFSQAITPTAASSKILAMLNPHIQSNPSGTYNGGTSVLLARSVAGGSYTTIGASNLQLYMTDSGVRYQDGYLNMNILDSPTYSLGDAITYKVQTKTSDANVTGRINVTSGGETNLASRLILIEVAA